MTKPLVRKLPQYGRREWWCLTRTDAKSFETWSEAMSYAVTLVAEPTA